jgi:ribosomal protein eS8
MGISRDSRHKRSASGAKRAFYRKKRKFELGRQGALPFLPGKVGRPTSSQWQVANLCTPRSLAHLAAASTKIGAKRIHTVRVRGGNLKHRALRLDSGNFAWGSEHCTKKTRIVGVQYNASNNELVRTNTLVKGSIVQIDATPFRQWYETHVSPPSPPPPVRLGLLGIRRLTTRSIRPLRATVRSAALGQDGQDDREADRGGQALEQRHPQDRRAQAGLEARPRVRTFVALALCDSAHDRD